MPSPLHLYYQCNDKGRCQTLAERQLKYCEVMKQAAMPSCLGGGERRDKHSIMSSRTRVDH